MNDIIKDNYKVLFGNALERLKELPDNSVDSIVTDPPYGLSNTSPELVSKTLTEWVTGNDTFIPDGKGFMGKAWDSFVPPPAIWKECFRVLKPGGHLLAFFGSRTQDLGGLSIRLAGFEIRDSVAWLYGSGFPKSMNIGKAIDKMPPATDDAVKWDGWGTALKPAHEPIVMARKPLSEGTVANNVIKWGTGGLNIDISRVGTETISTHNAPNGTFAGGEQARGSDTSSYTEHTGRFPANLILSHSEDCVDNGVKEVKTNGHWAKTNVSGYGEFGNGESTYEGVGRKPETETVSNYECVEGCPVKELDRQAPTTGAMAKVKAGHSGKSKGIYGDYAERGDNGATYYEDGLSGASRFFYVAKASKKDRNEGLEELEAKTPKFGNQVIEVEQGSVNDKFRTQPKNNFHPTVKPTALMAYLIKLTTQEGGIVLDPFTGSGSTGKAALLNGYKFIGCELTEEYLPIIEGRLSWANDQYEEAQALKAETLFELEEGE